MPPSEIVLRTVAGLLLILANGFFVAVEFGLTRARQFTKDEFVDSKGLQKAWDMTQNLEIYLTSCQVGITASSIALGVVAEPAIAALFEPLFSGTVFASFGAGVVLSFVVINLVHLTHGEQTPTYLGVERSKFVCRYGSRPLFWFTYLIKPIIELGDYVAKGTLGLFGVEMTGAWLETEEESIKSRSELRSKLRSTLKKGNLSRERRQEILAAFDVDKVLAKDEMVPADQVTYLSTANTPEENRRIVRESTYSRYPLVGDSIQDIRGVVYMPELARQSYQTEDEIELEKVAEPHITIDADTPLSDAIDIFQDEQQEIAMVTEDGEIVGLITVTDALEEVVGEIEDPLD